MILQIITCSNNIYVINLFMQLVINYYLNKVRLPKYRGLPPLYDIPLHGFPFSNSISTIFPAV